jgi:hypothetical protein
MGQFNWAFSIAEIASGRLVREWGLEIEDDENGKSTRERLMIPE